MKKSVSLLLAVCMTFSLVACAKTNDSQKSSNSSSDSGGTEAYVDVVGNPAPGGIATTTAKEEFTFGMLGEPMSLDPPTSRDATTPTGWLFHSQLYDTLLRYDAQTQQFHPVLATEWEINDDVTEVLFTLREGVKYHCGETMTADDVVWSLTRALEAGYTDALNDAIDHFEKVDETHIKVVLKYAYVPILQVLTVPCWGVVCPHDVQKCEANGSDFGRNPCGTGAYKFATWESGKQLTFDAFEDYWEGVPAIKKVTSTILGDASAGALALEEGLIDYFPSVATSDIQHLSTLDNLHVEILPGTAIVAICMNSTDGVFSDVRVRQAVSYAVNREDILTGAKNGNGSLAYCYCAPMCVGYDAEFQANKQNIEKAKQLLAEAGYPDGLTVTCQQDSSATYMPVAEVVQAQLKDIGINLEFDKMERTTWMDVVSVNRQFDITVRQSTYSIFDADYMLTRRLHSKNIGVGGNYSGYANPKLDEVLDAARTEPDAVKRQALYTEAYAIVRDDAPMIPLLYTASPQITNVNLRGMMDDASWRDLWSRLYFIR